MTKAEVQKAIALSVPEKFQANADAIADVYMKKAILKLGRTKGVHWNQKDVTFTLTSGKSSYNLGSDILSDYGDLKNLKFLWRTDTQRPGIPVLPVQEFNKTARGSTQTGQPQIATVHSDNLTFEVWPAPDSAYTMWVYIRKNIQNFKDIPSEYHDVLIDTAVASLRDPKAFAADGIREMREDSVLAWDGNTVPIDRHLGKGAGAAGPDSQNLRGD